MDAPVTIARAMPAPNEQHSQFEGGAYRDLFVEAHEAGLVANGAQCSGSGNGCAWSAILKKTLQKTARIRHRKQKPLKHAED